MIHTLVFDMGNVLVLYDPVQTMTQDGLPPQDRDVLMREVFASPEWAALDRGTMEKPEAYAHFCARLPANLADYIDKWAIRRSWMDRMPPFPEMFDLAAQLKAQGYGLYMLSNAGADFYSYSKNYPVMELMDGKVVSCDHHVLKPEPEIYRILFDRFDLRPEECLFLDDMQANIDGARRVGMDGICFSPTRESVAALRAALRAKGCRI